LRILIPDNGGFRFTKVRGYFWGGKNEIKRQAGSYEHHANRNFRRIVDCAAMLALIAGLDTTISSFACELAAPLTGSFPVGVKND